MNERQKFSLEMFLFNFLTAFHLVTSSKYMHFLAQMGTPFSQPGNS